MDNGGFGRWQEGYASQGSGYESQGAGLDGEQMVVLHFGAVQPHEFGEPQQVLDVVAGLAAAHEDLGGDLLVAGRSQVERVVSSGNVDQREQRRLFVPVWDEFHSLGDVAPQHRLPHI